MLKYSRVRVKVGASLLWLGKIAHDSHFRGAELHDFNRRKMSQLSAHDEREQDLAETLSDARNTRPKIEENPAEFHQRVIFSSVRIKKERKAEFSSFLYFLWATVECIAESYLFSFISTRLCLGGFFILLPSAASSLTFMHLSILTSATCSTSCTDMALSMRAHVWQIHMHVCVLCVCGKVLRN